MRKIIIASLVATSLGISAASFASQQFEINAKAGFSPQSWKSVNTKDVISVQAGAFGSSYYTVQIHVAQNDESQSAGIIVKNCSGKDSTITVTPGSSVICTLDVSNPVITFNSNSDKLIAHGDYQVE